MINKDDFLLSVVIPVYNEAGTISEILDRVTYAPFRKEIIVVDDGSTDGTRQLLEEIQNKAIRVYHHERNYGKGRALQTSFSAATGDVIVVQDADMEYDPNEFQILPIRFCQEKPMSYMVHGFQATGNTVSCISGTMLVTVS